VQVGHLIKQSLYTDRGTRVYRYGLVLEILPRKKIKVLWFPNHARSEQKGLYEEIIKMELIEIISEIR
jgi:hypothetical protein